MSGGKSGSAARVVLGALLVLSTARAHAGPKVAFLAAEDSPDKLGPQTRAAYLLARRLTAARLLVRAPAGFVGADGKKADLSAFDVAWYHQGDAIARTPLYGGPNLAALRRFLISGKGLLLSGGALAMVQQLGLEPSIRPQRRDPGAIRDPGRIVAVEAGHPVLAGLAADAQGVLWISRAGPAAVADFAWGGPARGMLIARSPGDLTNPLAEYATGAGRVIVLGGLLPNYADPANPHRANLERLTGNLLGYLGDRSRWRRVVIRTDFPPAAAGAEKGVTAQRWRALRMAVEDLTRTFGPRYPKGGEFLRRLEALRSEQTRMTPAQRMATFEALHAEALLANPLLAFESLLLVRRKADRLGLPMNYQGNSSLPPTGYDNRICLLSPPRPGGELTTLYQPQGGRFVGDMELHFDAKRLLLSMPGKTGRWRVHELLLATRAERALKLIDEPDVDNYDACYLPDGRILFTSTAPFTGVPCVGGASHVANLYLRDHGGAVRRLTFDQDHNWCPTVLNNGRVLYQRWEYADVPHTFYRLLFHMNPDGTEQMEYYGSNSYWPTALFYARPVPGQATKVVAVVGGHHDSPRMGELVILDPARGRFEADGVVQRIPGWGKPVKPVLQDGLIARSWPKFLHPWPLGDPATGAGGGKYFLTSCKPAPDRPWGIYLVDVFDNFVLLAEEAGYALLEPIPVQATARPAVIADKVDLSRKDAVVFLADVYAGAAMRGVPRGVVRSLRISGYEFAFQGMGGEPDRVGMDGPWDVRRILGTVPVAADGSAFFRVPANTPIALQPLDAEGKAVQWMRSWFTAMPGEVVSCAGCHERQNTAPPAARALATGRAPSEIKPWYGPARGFAFKREVQPVLDRFCVACHSAGATLPAGVPSPKGKPPADLTARPPIQTPGMGYNARFTPAYIELRKYVRSATQESDAHVLMPMEFHADTTRLVRMLRAGHHGVRLDAEAWDRLVTWIDLNAPAHGTWGEVCGHTKGEIVKKQRARRMAMNRKYAGVLTDPEAAAPTKPQAARAIAPAQPARAAGKEIDCPGWPFGAAAAARRQRGAGGSPPVLRVRLGADAAMEFVRIPPGEFVMGDGQARRRVKIGKAFWLGRFEVTNGQYACFDAGHDSGIETGDFEHFGPYQRGYPVNRPRQPVVRVSWNRAKAFCRWLGGKTPRRFTLPTEAQWEYACRAGTASPMWYGGPGDDFSRRANLSDATHHAVDYPHVPQAICPWRPAETRFDDGHRVSAPVGSFLPNPWGLCDMHGNAAEWTLSQAAAPGRRIVRGGSWCDRPFEAASSRRESYLAWQGVHDVGFRVACEDVGDD